MAINQYREGMVVEDVVILTAIELKRAKGGTGSPYLRLQFRDWKGKITGVLWEDSKRGVILSDEIVDGFKAGTPVRIEAKVQRVPPDKTYRYGGDLSLEVLHMETIGSDEW